MADLLHECVALCARPITDEARSGRHPQADEAVLSGAHVATEQLTALIAVVARLVVREVDLCRHQEKI